MGIRGVVRGDVERGRGARHYAGSRLLSVALQVLIGYVNSRGGDGQVIVAITAAVRAAGGGHIDDQHAATGQEVIAHVAEHSGIGVLVEGERHRAVIGVGH